jgi:anthranilate/para-aminobenzoate synthase component II
MAVKHKTAPVVGVQFHPESILTKYGKHILDNFLRGRL